MDALTVGDVFVSIKPVSLGKGKWAEPGWLWRVVEVYEPDRKRAYNFLSYGCVAHDAPTMYRTEVRHANVAKVVDKHKGDPYGKKAVQEKAVAAAATQTSGGRA